MAIVLSNFLHSLATFMASAAGIEYASTPRALWRGKAIEAQSADVYSTLINYGGPGRLWTPLPRISIQCKTTAKTGGEDAALNGSQKLFEALCDGDGRPWHMKTINGFLASSPATADGSWMLVSIDFLQVPGLIVAAKEAQAAAVFNFDVGFRKAS